jgi:flagellar biogenesis protein FliO
MRACTAAFGCILHLVHGMGVTAMAADVASVPAKQASGGARTTLPSSLPVKRQAMQAPDVGSWSLGVAVLAFGGAAGGAWLWKRGLGRSMHRRLRVGSERNALVRLSSQSLTPHASVHAVQWNGEEYLIACTPQSTTLLARKPAPGAPGADQ